MHETSNHKHCDHCNRPWHFLHKLGENEYCTDCVRHELYARGYVFIARAKARTMLFTKLYRAFKANVLKATGSKCYNRENLNHSVEARIRRLLRVYPSGDERYIYALLDGMVNLGVPIYKASVLLCDMPVKSVTIQ